MTEVGSLVDRIGARLHPTRDDTAILPVSPAVVYEGETLIAAMMLAADIASGIRLHDGEVTMVLTTSFSLHRTAMPTVGPVTVTSTRLFADDKRVVDRVTCHNDSGATVASGRIAFVTRRYDVESPAPIPGDVLSRYRTPWTDPIQEPLAVAAGIETVDPAIGRVELHAGDGVRRKGGIVQGAFVTLLGEASALALAEHTLREPAVVTSLAVDFLAAVGADAATTEARWLDTPGASMIEVVLRSDPTGSALAVFVVEVARARTR